MINTDQVSGLIGATAYDAAGDKIGKVGQVFLDDETGRPEFATVHTGLFGSNESFVPLNDASWNGDRLEVPFSKDQVKDAPNVDVSAGHISEQQEDELYRYYGGTSGTVTGTTTGTMAETGVGMGTETAGVGTMGTGLADRDSETFSRTDTATGAVGHDTSGPTTDDAMTVSEERLRVGTERREAGRARLRKYVVTESEQVPVTTRREEVRLEREPITDANIDRAMEGPAISEEEHEVVLHEERPVVATEAVPVERVRLTKDEVAEETTVGGEVRKERVDVEGDDVVDVRGTQNRVDR